MNHIQPIKQACLVNEAAIKNFSITDIAGPGLFNLVIQEKWNIFQILGVVKNFNYESLRNPIEPYILKFQNDGMLWGYVTVKISALELYKYNQCRLRKSGKNLCQMIHFSIISLMRILSRCNHRRNRMHRWQ